MIREAARNETEPTVNLRSGGRIRVWWNPESRTGIEGVATLVSREYDADMHGHEVWHVRFPNQFGTVERIVHPDDVM